MFLFLVESTDEGVPGGGGGGIDSREYVSKYNRREKYRDRWINR